MATTVPVQDAITGNEELRDLTEPLQALAQFYRALNGRDIALMEQNWDNTEQAAMDNPLGGIKRGWAEIKPVYERLFRVDGDYHFEFYDYTLHQFADIFYAVGRERGHVSIRGANLDMKIRTTRVFRFDGTRWRQVHHHGSIEDPKLLADYQNSVR
jgi:SnoaL-like domain